MTEPTVGSVPVGWSSIEAGDVVLGARDGRQWSVEAISTETGGARTVTLVDLEQQSVRHEGLTVRGVVRRVATGAAMRERAMAVVQVMLGGQVVSVMSHDDPRGHACPTVYLDPGSLAAHLLLFHATTATRNVDGTESTYAQLDGEHRALHHDIEQGNPREGTTTHWHDPDFDKRK